jgi:hypothetical protein
MPRIATPNMRWAEATVRSGSPVEKLYWDTDTDTVLWHGPKKGYFRGEKRYFSGLDFIARVTLHIPPKGKHLVRRYGVYSSRTRGTWKKRPSLASRAAYFAATAGSFQRRLVRPDGSRAATDGGRR